MAGFQRLATAVGVAQQGDKALGHQLDADIRRRTDLLLRSPPGAGSIILTSPRDLTDRRNRPRRRKGRHVRRTLETEGQLLDTATGTAIDVFSAANDIGPSPHHWALCNSSPRWAAYCLSPTRSVQNAGPRPLRHRNRLAATIARHPPRHGVVNCSRPRRRHCRNADFDEQPVHIFGEYRAINAVSWLIQQDDGDTITGKLGEMGWMKPPACRRRPRRYRGS